jgi:hypothetical protein
MACAAADAIINDAVAPMSDAHANSRRYAHRLNTAVTINLPTTQREYIRRSLSVHLPSGTAGRDFGKWPGRKR